MIFVYGGNAYPMSDRFGVGFEKYSEYEPVKDVIFFMPPWGEIAIVIGSLGIIIGIYRIVDAYLSVSHDARALGFTERVGSTLSTNILIVNNDHEFFT